MFGQNHPMVHSSPSPPFSERCSGFQWALGRGQKISHRRRDSPAEGREREGQHYHVPTAHAHPPPTGQALGVRTSQIQTPIFLSPWRRVQLFHHFTGEEIKTHRANDSPQDTKLSSAGMREPGTRAPGIIIWLSYSASPYFTFLAEGVGCESVPLLRADRPRKTEMYGATGLLFQLYIFKALKHQKWKGQSRGDTCRGLHPMTPVSRATTFRIQKKSWGKPFSAVSQRHTGGAKRISGTAKQALAGRTKGI